MIAEVTAEPWTLPERRIGGTEISKVLGLNPYGGPRSVYERIRNGYQEPSNPRMERGTREEPVIRQMFVDKMGAELHAHPGIVYLPGKDFASISPDDFCELGGDEFTVDYKSVSRWSAKKWGMAGTDSIPDHYLLQMIWAMLVTDKPRAILYASFGEDHKAGDPVYGKPGEVHDRVWFEHKWQAAYYIERDEEIEAALLLAGERFWHNHILPGIPPPADKPRRK